MANMHFYNWDRIYEKDKCKQEEYMYAKYMSACYQNYKGEKKWSLCLIWYFFEDCAFLYYLIRNSCSVA